MPDRDVKTVKDQIFFQYAKIIACSAFGFENGSIAKKEQYGFIKKRFRMLQSGEISWSDILREDKQLVDAEKKCVYCGAADDLSWEHIVPKSLKIKPECGDCDAIQSIHNHVWACRRCNSSKGNRGLYAFYQSMMPKEKYYDFLPALVEKKYLKTIYQCHVCAGTLDSPDADGNGKMDVLDVDFAVANFI